jgi:hypothetical protein
MNQKKNKSNKLYYTFILFSFLSVIFWFMTKLSKEYDSSIKYPVSYINLPSNKLLQEKPSEYIDVRIKATGFKLISSKVSPRKLTIDASNIYGKSLTNYYLLLSQQKLSVQKQLNTGVKVAYFIKDSVHFKLGVLNQKKVVVKLISDLLFAEGFELNNSISIQPDSILLTGPKLTLDTISFVSTGLLQKKELNVSINEFLDIKEFNPDSNVSAEKDKVLITASVERFTEGSVEVPIKVINIPDGKQINTFPKFVKVTYRIALSNFNKIDSSTFLIECDYGISENNNLPYLIPKLIGSSSMIKNARISPQKIDFLINKQL